MAEIGTWGNDGCMPVWRLIERRYNEVLLNMLHRFLEVTLQTIQHEVILHGVQVVTSKRQVISHDQAET